MSKTFNHISNQKNNKGIPKKTFYICIFSVLIILIVSFICLKSGVWRDLKYKYAMHTYSEKNYSSSIEAFKKLGDYKESKFYFFDSTYKYAKKLISEKKYRQASSQIELLEKNDKYVEYNDLELMNDQCYFYLSNVQKNFKQGDYDSVISMLETNQCTEAKSLYNKAVDKQREKEENYIMKLYKQGDYSEAFIEWDDSDYDISDKSRNKVINALCKELIQIYKDDTIDFYGTEAENRLSNLNHKYWTPTYKKWIKAYDKYDRILDY